MKADKYFLGITINRKVHDILREYHGKSLNYEVRKAIDRMVDDIPATENDRG